MDDRARTALRHGHRVDITTTGRRSGDAHRVELVFHNQGGRIFISGHPGRRGWYANLVAHPDFTFHLKGPVVADLPAQARPITERGERERVLAPIAAGWRVDLGVMVADAPLVEVLFDEAA